MWPLIVRLHASQDACTNLRQTRIQSSYSHLYLAFVGVRNEGNGLARGARLSNTEEENNNDGAKGKLHMPMRRLLPAAAAVAHMQWLPRPMR